MMRLLFVTISLCTVAICAGMSPAYLSAQTLNESEFHRLHEELKPADDEPWRTIPWKVSLLDAQQVAAAEHKPIFVWAMDGHPLGCT